MKNWLASIENLFETSPELKKEFNYRPGEFIQILKEDLEAYYQFPDSKIGLKNQLNLEEMFYIFSLKKQTTTKQVKIFKGRYQVFVTTGNRHVMKKLFGYSPFSRFEEALTSRLFKVKGFEKLAQFPTSQIPFVLIDSNIYLKYFLRAFRSLTGQTAA